MNAVENFISQYEDNQRAIIHYFHELLTKEMGLVDKIKFDVPFYYGKSWVCYLNPIKNTKIELAFLRGNENLLYGEVGF